MQQNEAEKSGKKAGSPHDLPGFGRAALSVIVPVLSCLGVQAVALPTAVLSTHTGGLGTPAKLSNPGYGPAALAHYQRLGLRFDCIYSGYLADPTQAKLVEQAFELWPRALKVVDPVLGDGGRLYKGLGADMVPAMYNLCSKANLIVPNVTEAALLLGDPLPGVGSSEQAAEQALAAVPGLAQADAEIRRLGFEAAKLAANGQGKEVWAPALEKVTQARQKRRELLAALGRKARHWADLLRRGAEEATCDESFSKATHPLS